MSRPLIGVTAAPERARWGPFDGEVHLAPRGYVDALQQAGATAVILPPDDAVAEAPAEVLDHLDGLLVSGGIDVDPLAYGARRARETAETDPARDRFELGLLTAALERDLPLLGVCRGGQLLNVACGGTLEQHLPNVIGSDRHRHTPGSFADHEVELEPGSLAARAAGAERLGVKSHHHQGLGEIGEGLLVTGRADDGVAEAIEAADRRFALGVLWHPEQDGESRVIAALVAAARDRQPVG